MNKKLQKIRYISSDFITAAIAWALFFAYRKKYIESVKFDMDFQFELTETFYKGLIFIPIFWVIMYYLSGYYKNIYRKSRLKELGKTLITTLIGVVIIFFVLILYYL